MLPARATTAGAGNGANTGGVSGADANATAGAASYHKSGQVLVYALAFGGTRSLTALFRLTQKRPASGPATVTVR